MYWYIIMFAVAIQIITVGVCDLLASLRIYINLGHFT